MNLKLDGDRARLYAERKKVEAQQGNPIHEGVTRGTRARMMREVISRAVFQDKVGNWVSFIPYLLKDIGRVFGYVPGGQVILVESNLEGMATDSTLDEFFQILELSAARLVKHRSDAQSDLDVLQSLLADDLSAFRFVNVGGEGGRAVIHVQKIDNEHLHKEITDRTFELTRVAELASAQNDYADAWRHYRKGDLDDAVSNAGKAVESACKAVIKKVDPASTPENLNLGPLVTLLVQRDIIPAATSNVAAQLEQIYRASGGLRNQAGTGAHGSVDLTTPQASVALLALRLSGTLIAFLAERWLQIK